MAWFRKKKKVIDLGERYRKQQELQNQTGTQPETQSNVQTQGNASGFALFDSQAGQTGSTTQTTNTANTNSGFVDLSSGQTGTGTSTEQKRRRLAKRILDMTTQMENLSNQIYHLQQRIEVLERKLSVNRFE